MSAQPQINTETGEVKQTMFDHAGNYAALAQMLLELAELEADPGHETPEEKDAREEQAESLRVTFAAALDATEGELGAKVDGIAWLINELQGHEEAAEAMRRTVAGVLARYQRRRDSYQNRIAGLKEYIGRCLDMAQLKKIEGRDHKAWWHCGKDKVEVAEGGAAAVLAAGFGHVKLTVTLPGDTDVAEIGKLLELATDAGGMCTTETVVDQPVLYAARNVLPAELAEVVTVTPQRHVRVS